MANFVGVTIISIVGFLLSIYAYSVEKKMKNKSYKPACDINKDISCTKAFSSKYGKLMGISNSVKGLFFYSLVILIAIFSLNLVFYLAILSMLMTIYLAYISYFKMKNFCLVCTGIYVVNILLLIFSF